MSSACCPAWAFRNCSMGYLIIYWQYLPSIAIDVTIDFCRCNDARHCRFHRRPWRYTQLLPEAGGLHLYGRFPRIDDVNTRSRVDLPFPVRAMHADVLDFRVPAWYLPRNSRLHRCLNVLNTYPGMFCTFIGQSRVPDWSMPVFLPCYVRDLRWSITFRGYGALCTLTRCGDFESD